MEGEAKTEIPMRNVSKHGSVDKEGIPLFSKEAPSETKSSFSDASPSEPISPLSDCSSSEPMLPEKSAEPLPHVDRGWAWMVMIGSTIMQCLFGGLVRSFGIIYVKWVNRFHSSASVTALVPAVAIGITLIGSPVAVGLSRRYTTRLVTFIGACLAGGGFILSAFGQSIGFMFFAIGIVSGIGTCLSYAPSIVHVGQYFDKKRGLAMGISHAGMGVGAFIISPSVEPLFSYYGLFGYHLIFGAITLNLCVAALFYRPLKQSQPRVIKLSDKPQEEHKDTEDHNTLVQDSTDPNKGSSSCSSIRSLVTFRYVCLFIGLSIPSAASDTARLFIFDHALNSGIDATSAALLLAVEGISDTVGKIISGLLFDLPAVRRVRGHLYFSIIGLLSVLFFIIAVLQSYAGLMTVYILHGFLAGAMGAQKSVITADVVGIENLSTSFGVVLMLQGVCCSFAPFVAGMLKDIYGTYLPSFCWAGALAGFSYILVYLSHFYSLYKKKSMQW